jgi:hypothetical protein
MDPRDRLDDLLDGVGCAVCRSRVGADRIQLLAQRDDLAFVEIDCDRCGSVSLGIVVEGDDHPPSGSNSVEGPVVERVAMPAADPIDEDDVLDMHRFLHTYSGDLRSLLADSPCDEPPGPRGFA